VSVRVAAPPDGAEQGVTARVSVQVAAAAVPTTSGVAPGVGVGIAPAPLAASSAAPHVSVTVEPVITALAPASGLRAGPTFVLTLSGEGLLGASALTFLRNNAPDPAITVTGLQVDGDGTQATAQITIAGSAVPGTRAVRITTPAGDSTAVGTGGNVFTVQ
jgi:hypothetical protein